MEKMRMDKINELAVEAERINKREEMKVQIAQQRLRAEILLLQLRWGNTQTVMEALENQIKVLQEQEQRLEEECSFSRQVFQKR
ncbi:NS4 protein [Palyam virus]|uniref:Nonstructural protein NS4 n=1 Tax=Palyam virus TaxID=40059 RepID=A0A8E8PIJ7_9REOV|nr:NS4 protein [Palyam virus]QWE80468.1 nonstructural protein NS4 [Palyam virus]